MAKHVQRVAHIDVVMCLFPHAIWLSSFHLLEREATDKIYI